MATAADREAETEEISKVPGRGVASRRWHNWWQRIDTSQVVVYVGLLLVFVFFAFALHDRGFLTGTNLMNIVRQTTPITVMAIGMTFCLSAGEIDLSIGSVVALSSLVTAVVLRETTAPVAILAGLGVGLAVGLVNGLLTVRVRIPSFLVTLGTLSIVTGLARTITNLQSVPVTHDTFAFWFGAGSFGPVSILFVWTAAAVGIGHFYYRHTRFGRHVLGVGGSREAAASVGINVGRIKIAVLVISAMAAAIAGMIYAGRLAGARYTLGEADLLTVIAATVVGGTSLFGGKGTVVGAIVGSIILGMLNNGLILMGLEVAEQMMARGLIIIIAVSLSLREAKE